MLAHCELRSEYSSELCEDDAMASGLEPEALHAQVEHYLRQYTEAQLEDILHARRIPFAGLDWLDKARMLAGVTGPRIGSALAPLGPISQETAASLEPVGMRSGALLTDATGANQQSRSCAQQHAACVAASTTDNILDKTPLQTSAIRRNLQHISAAVAPLAAQGAAMMLSAGSGALGSTAAAAGAAAVSGLTSSLATHEHHVQSQEMSRNLQRAALEQDRLLHEEAQATALRLAQENMNLDARLHRQGLWREEQQHNAAMTQELRLHEHALRVDHRLHFEGILTNLREQDREVRCRAKV